MKNKISKIYKYIYKSIITGVSFAFLLVFFAPLDFYYSNKNDVWYDVYNIFDGVMICFVVTSVFLSAVLILCKAIPKIGEKLNDILRFFLLYLLVSFYIQGNYVPIPYGNLNGTPIVWADYWTQDITSILLWIGILAILLVVKYKFSSKIYPIIEKVIELGLIGIAIFTLVVEFLLLDGRVMKYDKASTTKNEWTYSNDTNFIILVMDSLDSRVFTSLVRNNSDFEKMTENLDGFTFYRDTAGCYNLTDYSVPLILTGQVYLGQSTYGEFINTAYSDSMLFKRLTAEEYSKNIYANITLPQGEVSEEFDNLFRIRMKPLYEDKFIKDFYKNVAFRYVPTLLKRYFYSSFFESGANKKGDSSYSESNEEVFDCNNVIWNNEHQIEGFTIGDTKMFHYYHLMGIHPPRQYHSDFSFTKNTDEVSLEEGTVLCMEIIETWIEHLKKEGVYDNSVIIILGDHGSWEYEAEGNIAQAPVLLIKGLNEHHEPLVNNIPISYLDLQDAYMQLLDGTVSIDAFRNIEEYYKQSNSDAFLQSWEDFAKSEDNNYEFGGRTRLFFQTYLMNEMSTDSTGGPFFQYTTQYPVYEPGLMVTDGTEY